MTKGRRKRMAKEQDVDKVTQVPFFRRLTAAFTFTGAVLLSVAAIQLGNASFSIYSYSKLTQFVDCQADYNQKSNDARKPRVKAADIENDALFTWLETLPPLLTGSSATPQEQQKALRKFNRKLNDAIEAHADNVREKDENPYPADPTNTCGEV